MARSGRQTLSVFCPTSGPTRRVAAILETFRNVADELVCFVNHRLPDQALLPLEEIADTIVAYELGTEFAIEKCLPWMFSKCSGDWVFVVHADEVPSQALLRSLRDMTTSDYLCHLVTRHWLHEDVEHWLDESPWEPDLQARLVRNDPATLQFGKRSAHDGPIWQLPYRIHLDRPLYHLDNLLTTPEQRADRARFAEDRVPGQVLADGRPINEVFYQAERYKRWPLASVASEDVEVLAAIMNVDVPGEVIAPSGDDPDREIGAPQSRYPVHSSAEVTAAWPGRSFAADGYAGRILVASHALSVTDDLTRFTPGEQRWIVVTVENFGTETWDCGERGPAVFLASRWSTADNERPRVEGERAFITSTMRPGDSAAHLLRLTAPDEVGTWQLDVDLVHEGIRWFGIGPSFAVDVDQHSENRAE